uniref:Uncharacterized protein n=1 Tax=Rhizophora mucronata TaxID=61149 RepID=A0A2P2JQH1_RHIMU
MWDYFIAFFFNVQMREMILVLIKFTTKFISSSLLLLLSKLDA